MEERLHLDINYRDVIVRRLPLSLAIGAVLLIATVLMAMLLPSYYKSRAVVLIEAQEIPQDLVRSLVTSFADQRIQIISRRVLTNANLTSIIEKYDLYADERQSNPLEVVLETMREDFSVTPISAEVVDPKAGRAMQATIAFELAYENKSPELAQRVANEIVSLFLNENLKQRTETSEETLGFLRAESSKLRDAVASLETKLANFKKGNVERLPELASLNIEMMNRTEQEVSQLQSQMQSLQEQRTYIESNLAEQKPTTVMLTETGQRILGPADRLKVAESDFVSLSAIYGANHPDVVAKRKEIDSLKASVGTGTEANELKARLANTQSELSAIAKKYSADHPDVKRLTRAVELLKEQLAVQNERATSHAVPPPTPDNPVYVQLQARLQATEADMQAIGSQIAAKKAKVAEIEDRLAKTPEIEREYRELSRDYENAQLKYKEILAKEQDAELASNLESNQRGERFTLIEPPVTPEEPSKPNRIAIVLLGVLLSAAAAVGGGAVAESMDGNIYGRAGVLRALGVPPLAVIPLLDTKVTSKLRIRKRIVALLGLVLAITAVLTVVHIFLIPIDVLFYRVARKFGG